MNLTVVTRADQAASTNRQALKLSGLFRCYTCSTLPRIDPLCTTGSVHAGAIV